MQNLTITRTNGNIVRSLAGEDHISGLVFYSATLPQAAEGVDGFSTTERIHAISSPESAEKYGITADAESWEMKVLHYTLTSIFNMNPGITLYVGIFKPASGANAFSEIKQIQNYAGGRLRQVGVWNGAVELSDTLVTSLQSVRTTLEAQNKPLSILYAPKVTDVTKLPSDLAKIGRNGVSVIIGQDGAGVADALYRDAANAAKASVSALGDLLGAVSKAKVHESIAWVESFPTNISIPAFGDGKKYRDLDEAVIETLDNSRYIFLRTYDGLAGSFFNDNHTLDTATSDYAYINDVRTMDKAVRGVRTYLLPKLGRPMKVDPDTGKLERTAVEHLITTGNRPLEEMAKAGELSGYRFDIDPDQNILATSRVRGVIKNVAVGVMRNLDLEIGFATSL
ncbi:DUF2586 family protein [Muribaculaceae bacterium Z1]|nr:DUF2586 family protein [Muribaculaceae bacterium S4]NBI20831.1 DUF2586 family protein [Muribaculaceae bacterium Z1]